MKRQVSYLLPLFFGSGCAALMYEIIWFQLLELVIGSTGVSLGILLGTFMGGMCLGSLLLPRWISPAWHPLRVYAVLEAGIAVAGRRLSSRRGWTTRKSTAIGTSACSTFRGSGSTRSKWQTSIASWTVSENSPTPSL